jgi:hypothetical protein
MLKSSSQQLGGKYKKLSQLKQEYSNKKISLEKDSLSDQEKEKLKNRIDKLRKIIQKKKAYKKNLKRKKRSNKRNTATTNPSTPTTIPSSRSRNLSLRGGAKNKKKKFIEPKVRKERTPIELLATLKKRNRYLEKKLVKPPVDNKKKTIRNINYLKKVLERNKKIIETLEENNMTFKTAEKLLDVLQDSSNTTVQVGGGKTRMDSIKNSLKTYKRRYNNAKTEESQERLSKLYNKILLNKTKLNIKYYKNKLNELQKNL